MALYATAAAASTGTEQHDEKEKDGAVVSALSRTDMIKERQ
jgi:hypothetical protein